MRVAVRTELPVVPSLTRVSDAVEKAKYWNDLCRLWRVSFGMQHFPGSHPMPVDERATARMRSGDFVVALKTDGVRYVLLLTLSVDQTPIALMIDRTCTMYEVCVWAPYEFFESGTLLDGELAWNVVGDLPDNSMTFCVFDVVCVAGKHIADLAFSTRLQFIHESLFRAWKADMTEVELETHVRDECKIWCHQRDPHSIVFEPKTFSPYADSERVWSERVSCRQRVDGLLFTCRSSPMVVGRTDAILKWKPHHTVDVVLIRDGALSAMVDHRGRTTKARRAKRQRMRLSEALSIDVQVDDADFVMGEQVVECAVVDYDEVDGRVSRVRLAPLRVRDDKTDSNAPSTIASTFALQRVGIDAFTRTISGRDKSK